MSNIRTQFLHKGIMLGVCLIGVLISTYVPANDSENTKQPLLVEHRIEQQTSEEDYQMKMTLVATDSLLGADYRKAAVD